jgi:signal transduction histidine kinase
MSPLFGQRRQKYIYRVPPNFPRIFADSSRVRQVILNILSNANKFTPDGGSITVVCDRGGGSRESSVVDRESRMPRDQYLLATRDSPTRDPPNAPFVRVRVTDTGIGIRPEDADKVFEEFRQIDGSLSRPYGGTGLGLALSKRLIEMQGGTISFESTPSIGTTFTVIVPGQEQTPSPDPSPAFAMEGNSTEQRR